MKIKTNIARAEALLLQEKYAESLSICIKILEKKPNLDEAIHLTAINYYALGQIEPAIDEFKKAITINNQNSSFHSNLGIAYLKQERFTEASNHLYQSLTTICLYASTTKVITY